MVKGYYEYELQKFREIFRKSLKEKGLKLEERYETISFHITIARILEKVKNPKNLIRFIEEERKFGIIEVDSLELSFHNWYDTKKKVLANLKLK